MSIPERIWRIVRGRWLVAEEQAREAMAEAAAARELDEGTRGEGSGARPLSSGTGGSLRRPAVSRSAGTRVPKLDPLAADLALLGAPPACDMETLDRIYKERLAELRQQELPGSSSDPSSVRARRLALAEAYERLRDAINTTETRFEKLEF
jgi:hypothetical protein